MDRVIVSTKGNNKGMYIKLAVVLLLLIPVGFFMIINPGGLDKMNRQYGRIIEMFLGILLITIPIGSWFIGISLSKSFVEVTQRCVRGIAVSDKKVNPLTPQSTVLPKPSSAWASTK